MLMMWLVTADDPIRQACFMSAFLPGEADGVVAVLATPLGNMC